MSDPFSRITKKRPSCDQIINILPDPFVIIDRDYQIIAANNKYLQHYGYDHADDVIGKHCYAISHHVDAPCSQHGEHCPLENVFNTGQPTQVMHIHYDQNNKEEYVQLHSNPIKGANGEVIYVGEYIYPMNTPQQDSLLIGRSIPMLRMISMLQRVAPTQTGVLLLGDSGVGKECVANYIHQFSTRNKLPFIIVDCATLGENLIESELFGHEKGAFTGAANAKKGLFEIAHDGTLFIDEIGELPLSLQTKLLRVLETGTFRRLGGNDYHNVDVRVIAATNKNLQEMVKKGDFRQDLYYRLSAFPIKIPSLRERLDDIPALAEYFISRSEESDRFLPLQTNVLEKLLGYNYPGNVRELRNILDRATILAFGGEIIRPEHIVIEDDDIENPLSSYQHRKAFDSAYAPDSHNSDLLNRRTGHISESEIIQALESCHGHRSKAAQLLGVSERTMYRYVQKMRKKLDMVVSR
jgi:transcriptional regulator with GAF, ATPase, and Fis domain